MHYPRQMRVESVRHESDALKRLRSCFAIFQFETLVHVVAQCVCGLGKSQAIDEQFIAGTMLANGACHESGDRSVLHSLTKEGHLIRNNSQGETDMTLRNSNLALTISAAAVAIALGATSTFAQQQRTGESSEQGAQHDESGSQHQQQSGQRTQQSEQIGSQGQSASGQQRAGDSQLDRVVQMHAELGTFVEALEKAGLVEELAGDTKYTIFAPTNQAFESMQQDVADLLKPENRQQLVSLLRAHIVADDVDPQRARQLPAAQTLDGGTIDLSTENDKLMVGGASVVTPNIQVQGANLRIYSIDRVLDEAGQQSASATDRRSRG